MPVTPPHDAKRKGRCFSPLLLKAHQPPADDAIAHERIVETENGCICGRGNEGERLPWDKALACSIPKDGRVEDDGVRGREPTRARVSCIGNFVRSIRSIFPA